MGTSARNAVTRVTEGFERLEGGLCRGADTVGSQPIGPGRAARSLEAATRIDPTEHGADHGLLWLGRDVRQGGAARELVAIELDFLATLFLTL